jgi:methyltransferase (TIGR00027 family)
MVAVHRAIETERPDALFRDPLADRLAGIHGRNIVTALRGGATSMTGWMVVVRTCIIDDYIRLAVEHGVDAVLNLGAGLDTRPYRLQLPESLLWIEVDYPHMIELKESRLADETPVCRLERVPLDLADRPARRELLAKVSARATKILVLTEGVVPYLSVDEAASLADDLRALSNVAYWVVDYFSPATYKYRERASIKRKMKNAPFRFHPADYYGFFTRHGWRTSQVRYIAEEGERLGRPAPLPFWLKVGIRVMALFAPRARRGEFRKFMGYVLFEPAQV